MDKKEIYSYLTKEKPDLNIYMDEKMSKHTSFKIGGNADILVKVKTLEEIKYILSNNILVVKFIFIFNNE